MLEAKYNEAEGKRDVLIARHRATQAQRKVTETISQLPGFDSHSELDRMERRIRGEEAQAQAYSELQGESTDFQFAELDHDADIENELAAIKARVSGEDPKSLTSGNASQPDADPALAAGSTSSSDPGSSSSS